MPQTRLTSNRELLAMARCHVTGRPMPELPHDVRLVLLLVRAHRAHRAVLAPGYNPRAVAAVTAIAAALVPYCVRDEDTRETCRERLEAAAIDTDRTAATRYRARRQPAA